MCKNMGYKGYKLGESSSMSPLLTVYERNVEMNPGNGNFQDSMAHLHFDILSGFRF